MTDQHSLPPLPNLNWEERHSIQQTKDLLREYGQACAANARKAALEEAAQLCFDNADQIGPYPIGRYLAPFDHACEGVHSGMTYSKAIKELQ